MMIKNYNQKKKKQDFRSPIMTERFLTTVLKVSSCPKMTKKAVLLNMQSFMNQIDPATFEKDPNVFSLMLAIKIVLKNRLEGVDDPSDLVEYVNLEIMDNYEEQKSNIIFPTILSSTDTSDKEKNLVLNTIGGKITDLEIECEETASCPTTETTSIEDPLIKEQQMQSVKEAVATHDVDISKGVIADKNPKDSDYIKDVTSSTEGYSELVARYNKIFNKIILGV